MNTIEFEGIAAIDEDTDRFRTSPAEEETLHRINYALDARRVSRSNKRPPSAQENSVDAEADINDEGVEILHEQILLFTGEFVKTDLGQSKLMDAFIDDSEYITKHRQDLLFERVISLFSQDHFEIDLENSDRYKRTVPLVDNPTQLAEQEFESLNDDKLQRHALLIPDDIDLAVVVQKLCISTYERLCKIAKIYGFGTDLVLYSVVKERAISYLLDFGELHDLSPERILAAIDALRDEEVHENID